MLCFLFAASQTFAVETGGKLNIIFILADDLGAHDLTCTGSRFYETPNLDHLRSQGMLFTQAYASCPVCSPTRASIMTGKYPARLHLTDWIAGGRPPADAKLQRLAFLQHLPLSEVTLAEALKPAGYVCASIGKWHLGGKGFFPTEQGFDLNVAGCDKGSPPSYFSPYKIPSFPDGPAGEYLTDRLTNEAIKFVTQHKDEPFFLYFPHYAVHTPIQGKAQMIAHYKQKTPSNGQHNATYAAMIQSLDESVGRLMKTVDELHLADKTVVIFFSDNGGLTALHDEPEDAGGPTSNYPLRGGKGCLYEGGVREPFIVRWPGVVKPASTCDTPIISTDFFPTLLEIAGVKPDPKIPCDGLSIVPMFKGTGVVERDAFYWHYPHYHPGGSRCEGSIRAGDWKLIEFYEDMHIELFNLKDDPYERTDLAAKMPQKADELREKLHDWRSSVNAAMPVPKEKLPAEK